MTRRVGRQQDESGFSLVEVIVALALVAVVAVGFMGSVALGFRTVAVARQRTIASELATARLEHLRNIPYANIALSSAPVHNPDELHPDYFVSLSGTDYDVTGDGDWEPLIVDTAIGDVLQIEDPVEVGTTTMEVYQYVTWVDDPTIVGSQDYKRVLVTVLYKAPAANGTSVFSRTATLFTDGTVTYGAGSSTTVPVGATTTTAPSATSTVPAPAPTVPTGACVGDVTGPTGGFTIGTSGSSETGFTASANVSLLLSFADTCTPIVANFSNDGVNFGADVTYDATTPQLSWSLTGGNGFKTVYAQVRDGAGNVSVLTSQSITLDATAPSVPVTVNRTISCSGSTRDVTLSWSQSIDAEGNLRGYRVYRSTDSSTWSELTPAVATLTKSDSHSKTLNSVRYYVVAYDKAGNVSAAAPSPVISLAKNQCS